MQKRSIFFASMAALFFIAALSSCRKTITLGNKPTISVVAGPDLISSDSTLAQDTRYQIKISTARAEDQSPNTTFEVERTYSSEGTDSTVFYQTLTGADQTAFDYIHTFTTLKKAGTERYTFTISNSYGIVNQQILIMTVK